MVNSRSYVCLTRKTCEVRLRCRLYSTEKTKPHPAQLSVRCANNSLIAKRYPYAEVLFGDAIIQPYIHNCIVEVHEGDLVHHLVVFFKRHHRLPPNRSIRGRNMRGDVVVMRAAANDHTFVVNMRGRDGAIADWVIPRFAKHVKKWGRPPTTLRFHKK